MSAPAARFDPARMSAADPPPYTQIRPEREAPRFVLVCDHASNAVPAHMERLGLDQAELDRHIGWDIGAAMVTESLSARLDAPACLSGYSRLVVDCNRPPGSPTAMPAVSDGTVVPANQAILTRGGGGPDGRALPALSRRHRHLPRPGAGRGPGADAGGGPQLHAGVRRALPGRGTSGCSTSTTTGWCSR